MYRLFLACIAKSLVLHGLIDLKDKPKFKIPTKLGECNIMSEINLPAKKYDPG
jgi:hypothetical protein